MYSFTPVWKLAELARKRANMNLFVTSEWIINLDQVSCAKRDGTKVLFWIADCYEAMSFEDDDAIRFWKEFLAHRKEV